MKTQIRLLSLLLALVMLLCSCNYLITNDADATTDPISAEDSSTEAVTSDPTAETSESDTEESNQVTTEKKTEATTEAVTETVTPAFTPSGDLKYSRKESTLTKDDVLVMYTLTQTDYDTAIVLLNTFLELGLNADNYDVVDAAYYEFEDAFYHIQTQSSIANIIYYCDTTDEYAMEIHKFADDTIRDLQDEYVEACKKLYYESPYKDELFADWTEEDIQEMLDYNPEVNELKSRNDEIIMAYNTLSSAEQYQRIAEFYVEFIQNNNRIAEIYGYDNYYDYATKKVYGRDYTRADLENFKNNFLQYLYPEESNIINNYNYWADKNSTTKNNVWKNFQSKAFDQLSTKNYLIDYANYAPGGLGEAMRHMFENKNVIVTNNPNAHMSAFQTYLYEYETPFCLFGASQSSETVAHELGHYYAALTNHELTSLDLMETHSQGNEFLFLTYVRTQMDPNVFNAMMAYNMYNNYCMIMVCLMIDEFEQKVYSLDSVEGFTASDFDAIMEEVCDQYGGLARINANITGIQSYWRMIVLEAPVYYISYAVSLTEALNIYAIAREDEVKAHEVYKFIVEDAIPEDGFLITLQKAGLSSPFDADTMKAIAAMMAPES